MLSSNILTLRKYLADLHLCLIFSFTRCNLYLTETSGAVFILSILTSIADYLEFMHCDLLYLRQYHSHHGKTV